MHLSLARADLPVLAQALPAWQAGDLLRIRELNDWVQQTRESAELRQQTQQMGRSLGEWLKNRPEPDRARRAARRAAARAHLAGGFCAGRRADRRARCVTCC